jgi:hypothetical protein
MSTTKNECNKVRPQDNPYEIWQSLDGLWEWRVLRKYQSPEKEATNPYARWFVATHSPFLRAGDYDLGDEYVRGIKSNSRRIK